MLLSVLSVVYALYERFCLLSSFVKDWVDEVYEEFPDKVIRLYFELFGEESNDQTKMKRNY